MNEEEIKKKSLIATRNHLKNIELIAKGKAALTNYDYLLYCWICGKPITFWDRIFFRYQHSFEGNCHKKCSR